MDGTIDLAEPPSLGELQARGPIALFIDFDGTLVEIAATPDGIVVPARLAAQLYEVGERLDGRLALVSGRAIDNLEEHLGPLAIARAGSHGVSVMLADGTRLGEEPLAIPDAAGGALREFAEREGFILETKPHGAALHFRGDPALETLGLDFAAELAAKHDLAVKRGKCVIELVRIGADKGSAVRAFMAEPSFAGAMPVFLGDDVTDEDGFAAAEEAGGFGILVGNRRPTRAHYQLSTPDEVHQWLGL